MEKENEFGSKKKNFEKIKEIGAGTYGIVYKGINKQTEKIIAIKKIKIEVQTEGIPSTALREICILRDLKHEHIVELNDVLCEKNKLYLIFEFLDLDLRKYLEEFGEGKYLQQNTIKSFLFQILDCLAYCHAKKIIHRDIKL